MRLRSSLIGLAACVALMACDKTPAGDGVDEKVLGEDVTKQKAAAETAPNADLSTPVSYTHLRAHET